MIRTEAKRTLTPGNVCGTVANVVTSVPALLAALVRPKTVSYTHLTLPTTILV